LSKAKDIARAIAGNPHKPAVEKPVMYLRCGKCHLSMPEYKVTEHLVGTPTMPGCQPVTTECGKCFRLIPSDKFLEHFKVCDGRPTVGLIGIKKQEEKNGKS